jgi:FkbM family methyltransferase
MKYLRRILRGLARRTVHLRQASESCLLAAALRLPPLWKGMNAYYNVLTDSGKERFYLDHVYRQNTFAGGPGLSPSHPAIEWVVCFAGKRIRIPLSRESLAFDWGLALCLIGLDTPVKHLYSTLVRSPLRPAVIFDVGCNFGQNLYLFLAHGIPTVAFEPNTDCHKVINSVCAENCFIPNIQPFAVGNSNEPLILTSPQDESWLGSVHEGMEWEALSSKTLIRREVKQTSLDSYLPEAKGRLILVKIDVEGHELEVLQGARQMLLNHDCLVVFEHSQEKKSGRTLIHQLLTSLDYQIYNLESLLEEKSLPLDQESFLALPGNNHLALKKNGAYAQWFGDLEN